MGLTRPFRVALPLVLVIHIAIACADETSSPAPSPSPPPSTSPVDPPPPPPPTSILAQYKLHKSPEESERLPKALHEISGLAVTADGRLLCHDDERAIVYELDVDRGKIVKKFRLGEKGVKADFEGIAVAESSLFLVTSDGILYETNEGRDGESMEFSQVDTGVGDRCEVEGLEFDPVERMLLLACKTNRAADLENVVAIFRWSLDTRRLGVPGVTRIWKRAIRERLGVQDFHPSGIAIHPPSGHRFVVAARERAVIEFTREGRLVGASHLKSKYHSRPEGIALRAGRDGRGDLIISDEGEDRRARLARYRRRESSD